MCFEVLQTLVSGDFEIKGNKAVAMDEEDVR